MLFHIAGMSQKHTLDFFDLNLNFLIMLNFSPYDATGVDRSQRIGNNISSNIGLASRLSSSGTIDYN